MRIELSDSANQLLRKGIAKGFFPKLAFFVSGLEMRKLLTVGKGALSDGGYALGVYNAC